MHWWYSWSVTTLAAQALKYRRMKNWCQFVKYKRKSYYKGTKLQSKFMLLYSWIRAGLDNQLHELSSWSWFTFPVIFLLGILSAEKKISPLKPIFPVFQPYSDIYNSSTSHDHRTISSWYRKRGLFKTSVQLLYNISLTIRQSHGAHLLCSHGSPGSIFQLFLLFAFWCALALKNSWLNLTLGCFCSFRLTCLLLLSSLSDKLKTSWFCWILGLWSYVASRGASPKAIILCLFILSACLI